MMRQVWAWAAVLTLGACGGGVATGDGSMELDETSGGEAGECRLAETPVGTYRLPELPEEFDLLEPAHREAWDMAQAVLEREAPEAPTEPTVEAVQAYASGPFSTFVSEYNEAMAQAEARLNTLAEGPEGVRVVSSTLVGLMYYHLALEMLEAPVPTEVAENPETRALYLSAIREGVQPLVDTAADRAEYCVYAASQQPEALHRWRVYCFSMIGHTVVQEHRVVSLLRAADVEARSPEYITRRYGEPTPGARVAPGTPTVEGELAPDAVAAFINAHQRPLLACYQRGLADDEGLHGQVVLAFGVGADGATSDVQVTVSTIEVAVVTECIVSAVDAFTFPAPESGEARVFVALDLRVTSTTDEESAAESP